MSSLFNSTSKTEILQIMNELLCVTSTEDEVQKSLEKIVPQDKSQDERSFTAEDYNIIRDVLIELNKERLCEDEVQKALKKIENLVRNEWITIGSMHGIPFKIEDISKSFNRERILIDVKRLWYINLRLIIGVGPRTRQIITVSRMKKLDWLLRIFSESGDLECVRALIELGADVNNSIDSTLYLTISDTRLVVDYEPGNETMTTSRSRPSPQPSPRSSA